MNNQTFASILNRDREPQDLQAIGVASKLSVSREQEPQELQDIELQNTATLIVANIIIAFFDLTIAIYRALLRLAFAVVYAISGFVSDIWFCWRR